jgi:hypothetical protein
MSSRGNRVFVDTVATASAQTPEFLPSNVIISATGIISLYDPTPIPCQPTSPVYFSRFSAACNQLSGSFSGGYIINPNPAPTVPSQGTLIAGVNIGVFSKIPTVTWCPASAAAGTLKVLYRPCGIVTEEDGSYFFGIYVGATTWPGLDPSWTGPTNLINFNFVIFS